MAEAFELELPFTSRFKNTRLFIQQGRAFFGIWMPLDITLDGDEEHFPIQQGMEGTCEFVAGIVYGDRSLWPVIAQANHIDKPFEDVKAGMVLIIPKKDRVDAALLAAAKRSLESSGIEM